MKKIMYGSLFVFISLVGIVNIIPVMAAVSDPSQPNAQPVSHNTKRAEVSGYGNDGNLIYSEDGKEDSDGGLKKSQLLDTAKKTINWLLGMLATIALVICLYGGFLMVTAAGNDSNYKKGITILKQAAIGLAIIGLAWLIVSVVFWLVGAMTP